MSDFFDVVIRFILDHNEAVVQWLFVLVVAWAALLLGTSIFRRDPEESEGAAGASVNSGVQAVPMETLQMLTEVTKLKDELIQRGKEVETLKTELTSSKGAKVDTSKFEEKITELEGKLAEYEILEDDIADLSLYKEENVRLKQELAKVSGGAMPAAAPAAPVAQAVMEEPAGLAGVEPPPAPLADDELIEEFATAVEKSKEAKIETEPSDDLLKEFAASLDGGGGGETAGDDDLDTEKMIAEVAALDDSGEDPSLEEDADMDKMAQEASKLLGQDS